MPNDFRPARRTEYSVRDASPFTPFGPDALKSFCEWGKVPGAFQRDGQWVIPVAAIEEIQRHYPRGMMTASFHMDVDPDRRP